MFPAGQSLTASHIGSDPNVSGFGRVGEEGDDNVNTLYSLVWSMAESWQRGGDITDRNIMQGFPSFQL